MKNKNPCYKLTNSDISDNDLRSVRNLIDKHPIYRFQEGDYIELDQDTNFVTVFRSGGSPKINMPVDVWERVSYLM